MARPATYHAQNGCWNCEHCETTVHEDMTERYCTFGVEVPPRPVALDDWDDESIWEPRRQFEVDQDVKAYGICLGWKEREDDE